MSETENQDALKSVSREVEAGQAVYSKGILRIYDILVLAISNPLIWRCPTGRLLKMYNNHITSNHLDVGVGTGYFLDRCQFPTTSPRLALMDLNTNCLHAAAERVSRYRPAIFQRNVLEPIPLDGGLIGAGPFDSIGVNYLLHCLPGTIPTKAVLFDHLRPLLKPGGVVFGSTLLAEGVRRSFLARRLMRHYNTTGIFSNSQDRLGQLEQALQSRFEESEVRTVGCAALFWARKKSP